MLFSLRAAGDGCCAIVLSSGLVFALLLWVRSPPAQLAFVVCCFVWFVAFIASAHFLEFSGIRSSVHYSNACGVYSRKFDQTGKQTGSFELSAIAYSNKPRNSKWVVLTRKIDKLLTVVSTGGNTRSFTRHTSSRLRRAYRDRSSFARPHGTRDAQTSVIDSSAKELPNESWLTYTHVSTRDYAYLTPVFLIELSKGATNSFSIVYRSNKCVRGPARAPLEPPTTPKPLANGCINGVQPL